MALIDSDSTCAICGGALDRPYRATSGVAFPPDHPLWRYCDAPLHVDCLARWASREEFSREYCAQELLWYREGNGTLLRAAAGWFLACPPAPPGEEHPRFACVRLAAWPIRLSSRWGEWDAFVAGGYGGDLAGPELDAADAVMAEVRAEVPSARALAALHAKRSGRPVRRRRSLVEFGRYLGRLWGEAAPRTDWRLLERERRAQAEARAEQERARARRIARSNENARRLATELASGGPLTCPHCHGRTREMRFVDRGSDAESYFSGDTESYFICPACGRSFTGAAGSDAQ